MKRTIIIGALIAAAIGGFAIAQTTPVPKVTSVGPTDVFKDIVSGVPSVQNSYATAAQINGTPGYKNLGTITTDPAYTVADGVSNVFGHGTTTISAVTITMEPDPADGKRICFRADQTTTTFAFHANTGQTVSSTRTAGVANVPNCMTYSAIDATWYKSN